MDQISKGTYEKNKKELEKKYNEMKKEICKEYNISSSVYDMFAKIIANEKFREDIAEEAKEGCFVEGIDDGVTLL